MKTAEIKDLLKKELLIIELPRLSDYHASERKLWVKDTQSGEELTIKGSWDVLGKPDEIKESDARELLETLWNGFRNYSEDGSVGNYQKLVYKTALESFFSALESEIFWENPYAEPDKFIDGFDNPCYEWWHEAQEKTFDKNRTLLFVKN